MVTVQIDVLKGPETCFRSVRKGGIDLQTTWTARLKGIKKIGLSAAQN
jgi:hypothetical protein